MILSTFYFFPNVFIDLKILKVLSWTFFFSSLGAFFLYFSFFHFFSKNKKEIKTMYKTLQVIFFTVLINVFVGIVFILKVNDIVSWQNKILVLILLPVQIITTFVGVSLSIKLFHNWQKLFLGYSFSKTKISSK